MGLDASDSLAVTAIAIAVVALCGTIGQILQQYLGTSEGYRRCQSSVMGLWAQETRRIFNWGEMRFEVIFQTPVIYLSRPFNDRWPLINRPIHYVDGSSGSYKDTGVEEPLVRQQNLMDRWGHNMVASGTDGEETSWVTLLGVLQGAEAKSREWDHKRLAAPRSIKYNNPDYTLCVAIQKRTQSWKFVPSGVVKPYAFTTMSALIELVAFLGMHWVAFDQATGNVVAEGNGFVVTSALVTGLGMLANFAVTSRPEFRETRVIPHENIGELCFGLVPIINFSDVDGDLDQRVARQPKIGFGSQHVVRETLEYIGLDFPTVSKYEDLHGHQFSVAFEIIGMLAIPFRIRRSSFRRLPNPTTDYWLGHAFAPLRALKYFNGNLQEHFHDASSLTAVHFRDAPILTEVSGYANRILQVSKNTSTYPDIDQLEATHDALDMATTGLQSHTRGDVFSVITKHITHVINELQDPKCILNTQKRNRDPAADEKEKGLVDFYFTEIAWYSREGSDPSLLVLLVFRMLCWLVLHDFDEADRKLVPSNLYGSSVPVYIG